MTYTKASHCDLANGITMVATLDWKTCNTCGSLDGRNYRWEEIESGNVHMPPHHDGCRCTVVLWMKPAESLGMPNIGTSWRKRASAVGPVPQTMTYPQWIRLYPHSK
ncbi:hypothetical protein Q5R41_004472 [Salmonella enterica]|uniref:phage minor head protein n=1 Tax=Salmonella enterica TaxID=28901 RepID=UPI00098D05E9|nr:hypothetical protein [Salmonella enterica]EBX6524861.1 hypothetical protein [Salmonella enterica subsp. enterica serovar Nchanga]EBX8442117.1 hypothetical protein [Salmonella enterica subsp. enterica serovar Oranienburg]ECE0257656.1 hypothetical protein [Salmonella enterica subsp. enterica]ECX1196454.1 hypothetical protein [Salmonella enterica subsp. enterica serovar Bareilly]EDT2894220.1 hypothetical protein [Salmonella enterica subsp. enterica serovar Litchfield]EII0539437.1 hypothetical